MSKLLQIATQEIGVKEVPGEEHNKQIITYAKEAGFKWVNDDETPWCSIFVNWCAKKAQLKQTKKANARSWLTVGMPTSTPEPGDVVVFWRGSEDSWKGHVGFYLGYSKDASRIYCLGGNQGNQVSISAMPASQLLGFRRLTASSTWSVPDKRLTEGHTGDAVKQLQDALKMAGFDCGTSDGIYGPKTTATVRRLQSTNEDIEINGIFTKETRVYLLELLNG